MRAYALYLVLTIAGCSLAKTLVPRGAKENYHSLSNNGAEAEEESDTQASISPLKIPKINTQGTQCYDVPSSKRGAPDEDRLVPPHALQYNKYKRRRSPFGIVYNQGKPIGILEPISHVYEFQNAQPDLEIDSKLPTKRDSDAYPNTLANFKIGTRLLSAKPSASVEDVEEEPREKKKWDKRANKWAKRSVETVKEKRDLTDGGSLAAIEENLRSIMNDLGLIKEEDKKVVGKREAELDYDDDFDAEDDYSSSRINKREIPDEAVVEEIAENAAYKKTAGDFVVGEAKLTKRDATTNEHSAELADSKASNGKVVESGDGKVTKREALQNTDAKASSGEMIDGKATNAEAGADKVNKREALQSGDAKATNVEVAKTGDDGKVVVLDKVTKREAVNKATKRDAAPKREIGDNKDAKATIGKIAESGGDKQAKRDVANSKVTNGNVVKSALPSPVDKTGDDKLNKRETVKSTNNENAKVSNGKLVQSGEGKLTKRDAEKAKIAKGEIAKAISNSNVVEAKKVAKRDAVKGDKAKVVETKTDVMKPEDSKLSKRDADSAVKVLKTDTKDAAISKRDTSKDREVSNAEKLNVGEKGLNILKGVDGGERKMIKRDTKSERDAKEAAKAAVAEDEDLETGANKIGIAKEIHNGGGGGEGGAKKNLRKGSMLAMPNEDLRIEQDGSKKNDAMLHTLKNNDDNYESQDAALKHNDASLHPLKLNEDKLEDIDGNKDAALQEEEILDYAAEGERYIRQKRQQQQNKNSNNNSENNDLMKGLETSGDLTVSGNKSPLASSSTAALDSEGKQKVLKERNEKHAEDLEYEKRMQRNIREKLMKIKEDVKREISALKKDNKNKVKRDVPPENNAQEREKRAGDSAKKKNTVEAADDNTEMKKKDEDAAEDRGGDAKKKKNVEKEEEDKDGMEKRGLEGKKKTTENVDEKASGREKRSDFIGVEQAVGGSERRRTELKNAGSEGIKKRDKRNLLEKESESLKPARNIEEPQEVHLRKRRDLNYQDFTGEVLNVDHDDVKKRDLSYEDADDERVSWRELEEEDEDDAKVDKRELHDDFEYDEEPSPLKESRSKRGDGFKVISEMKNRDENVQQFPGVNNVENEVLEKRDNSARTEDGTQKRNNFDKISESDLAERDNYAAKYNEAMKNRDANAKYNEAMETRDANAKYNEADANAKYIETMEALDANAKFNEMRDANALETRDANARYNEGDEKSDNVAKFDEDVENTDNEDLLERKDNRGGPQNRVLVAKRGFKSENKEEDSKSDFWDAQNRNVVRTPPDRRDTRALARSGSRARSAAAALSKRSPEPVSNIEVELHTGGGDRVRTTHAKRERQQDDRIDSVETLQEDVKERSKREENLKEMDEQEEDVKERFKRADNFKENDENEKDVKERFKRAERVNEKDNRGEDLKERDKREDARKATTGVGGFQILELPDNANGNLKKDDAKDKRNAATAKKVSKREAEQQKDEKKRNEESNADKPAAIQNKAADEKAQQDVKKLDGKDLEKRASTDDGKKLGAKELAKREDGAKHTNKDENKREDAKRSEDKSTKEDKRADEAKKVVAKDEKDTKDEKKRDSKVVTEEENKRDSKMVNEKEKIVSKRSDQKDNGGLRLGRSSGNLNPEISLEDMQRLDSESSSRRRKRADDDALGQFRNYRGDEDEADDESDEFDDDNFDDRTANLIRKRALYDYDDFGDYEAEEEGEEEPTGGGVEKGLSYLRGYVSGINADAYGDRNYLYAGRGRRKRGTLEQHANTDSLTPIQSEDANTLNQNENSIQKRNANNDNQPFLLEENSENANQRGKRNALSDNTIARGDANVQHEGIDAQNAFLDATNSRKKRNENAAIASSRRNEARRRRSDDAGPVRRRRSDDAGIARRRRSDEENEDMDGFVFNGIGRRKRMEYLHGKSESAANEEDARNREDEEAERKKKSVNQREDSAKREEETPDIDDRRKIKVNQLDDPSKLEEENTDNRRKRRFNQLDESAKLDEEMVDNREKRSFNQLDGSAKLEAETADNDNRRKRTVNQVGDSAKREDDTKNQLVDGEIIDDRRKRSVFTDLVGIHSGGPMLRHLAAARERSLQHMDSNSRMKRLEEEKLKTKKDQGIAGLSEADFGGLPQSYEGELSRFKRVKRFD